MGVTDLSDLVAAVEAQLLLRGVLVREYRRDTNQPPDEFGNRPLLLIDGRVQVRWRTNQLSPYVQDLLSPEHFARLRTLPEPSIWPSIREVLDERGLVTLLRRARLGDPTAAPPKKYSNKKQLAIATNTP